MLTFFFQQRIPHVQLPKVPEVGPMVFRWSQSFLCLFSHGAIAHTWKQEQHEARHQPGDIHGKTQQTRVNRQHSEVLHTVIASDTRFQLRPLLLLFLNLNSLISSLPSSCFYLLSASAMLEHWLTGTQWDTLYTTVIRHISLILPSPSHTWCSLELLHTTAGSVSTDIATPLLTCCQPVTLLHCFSHWTMWEVWTNSDTSLFGCSLRTWTCFYVTQSDLWRVTDVQTVCSVSQSLRLERSWTDRGERWNNTKRQCRI